MTPWTPTVAGAWRKTFLMLHFLKILYPALSASAKVDLKFGICATK